ncbi:MAG: hypothetical protein ACTHU0_15340 [Kofleriaceae bacterium]
MAPQERSSRRSAVPRIALALLALGLSASAALAQPAPRAQFSLGRGNQPHAGVPFHIDLMVEGFEEAPAPVQPKLDIPNAVVTPAGVTPSTARSVQIINGRRMDSTRTTWVLRYRVLVDKPGRLRVPATTVVQGSKQATAQAGEADVEAVPTADDMKVELQLPNRAVFVGETIPVKMVWLFRRQPEEQTFNAPLMGLDAFTVSAPPVANPRRAITIAGGQKDLQLPFEIDQTTVGGVEYNRVTATFFAAPRTTGKVEVPASSVLAALPVGRADFFGNAPTRMFRATDVPRTLEVKPLPETNRPPHFAGAVGDQFSIEVRTSRSVVQLGEPVELDIRIKSNQRLDTLSIGKLDGEGRLPKDKFTAPVDAPTGELSDDATTKTFKVVAQVIGPATEVPALAFSYFDPVKGTYQTIHSEPIALSVKGSTMVGAGDVVGATPSKRPAAGPAPDDTATVNADLALSSASAVGDRPLSGGLLWILVGALYAVPLALLGFRSWQLRTAGQREEASEVRTARRRVEELLDRAGNAPARDLAGPLVAALRELARAAGRAPGNDGGLFAKLETESFAPGAASAPLSPDLRSDAAGLLRRWVHEARAGRAARASSKATTAALLLALVGAPSLAEADALGEGRQLYQDAMQLANDASARRAAFARAAVALGEAARAQPDRPELLADWGNAALGAGDVATATLAYRRALALDGGNQRARHNLAWLRSRQPDAFRPTGNTGATDALLFFHQWPRGQRLLVGAGAFAIAILLVVPWRGRRRRGMVALAALPLAAWLAMVASVVLEDRRTSDAVVMDGVVMRAADSAGAPAAMSQPLPRGAEVTILERRDAWTRIRIASGTTGWVPGGAVERIAR